MRQPALRGIEPARRRHGRQPLHAHVGEAHREAALGVMCHGHAYGWRPASRRRLRRRRGRAPPEQEQPAAAGEAEGEGVRSALLAHELVAHARVGNEPAAAIDDGMSGLQELRHVFLRALMACKVLIVRAREALLRLEQLRGAGGMNATLHKSVLKNLLASSLAAFDVLPVHKLRAAELASLLDVLEELTAGQPALCEQFWGGARADGLEAPLVALLVGCRERHPADATPFLRALTALAEGPRAAACALAFLRNLPSVALPAPGDGEETAGAVVPLDADGAPRSEWVDAMARWREARVSAETLNPPPPLPPGPVAAAADLASAHLPGACVPRGAAGTQAWPASEADLGDRMLEAASRLRIVAVRILHALSAELADRVEAGSAADPSVLDAWLYHDARCEPGNEECGCAKGPHLDPGLLTVKRASAVAALQCRDVATGKWHAVEAACKPNDLLVLANAELAELELAHAAEHLVMTSAERFSLVYELRAPVELTTGWGEANSESDATDDEEEDGEVDQGSGEESWLARQLRLARVS